MTAAVAIRDTAPSTETELVGGTGLEAWARNARLATQVAEQLAYTNFVPASLIVRKLDDRGRPTGEVDHKATTGNILGALLTGEELGLEPMAALRSIDIIKGTPALRAIAMRAIVQGAGHEIVVKEATETRAVVEGRRKGSTIWQKSVWTIDRARKLGLLSRDQWRQQPTAMLIARASAECARLIAADALLGMPYTSEELEDDLDGVDVPEGSEQARDKPRTARRRGAAQAVAKPATSEPTDAEPEPDFDSEAPSPAPQSNEKSEAANDAPPSSAAASDPSAELATKPQLQKLHILFGENGLTDRAAGLAYISGEIGRDVTSSKQLTKGEATQLIDSLERRGARQTAEPAEPSFEEVPLPDEPPEQE